MKKNKIIFIIIGIVLVVALGVLLGFKFIGKNNKTNNNEKNTNIKEKEEKKITIIDLDSNTRPYAVMINTHNAALPQSGLQDAYIVYELMVEGGITRMMALFKDVDFDKVGSIRSARAQYLPYVYENDAIYVHAGGSKEALELIQSEKINDIDVDGKYGVRDKGLNRAYEHTLFTNTSLLKQAINDKGLRSTTDNHSLLKYSAKEIDLSKYETSKKANNVSIRYSNYRTSIYNYDAENKVYSRYLNNTKNVDLVTGEEYKVKNIIAYALNHTTYTDHGYYGYQKIDNIGTGEGVYISNGYSIPIVWTKNSRTEKTIYTIKETGEELVVNDGNTYIQIYPSDGSLSIE